MNKACVLGCVVLLEAGMLTCHGNLVGDPGFEGTGNGPWTVALSDANFTTDFDSTADAHSGGQALRVTWSAQIPQWRSAVAEQIISLTAKGGAEWYAEAYGKVAEPIDGAEAYLETLFYDAAWNEIGKLQSGFLRTADGWKKLHNTAPVPTNAAAARVRLVVFLRYGSSSSGTMCWDDVVVQVRPADAGFESAGAGSWTYSESHANFAVDFDSTESVRTGSRALRMGWSSSIPQWNWAAANQDLDVTEDRGEPWNAQVHAKVSTPLANASAYLETVFYDAGWTELGKLQSRALSATCNWSRLTNAGTVPTNASTARCRLVVLASGGSSGSGTVHWDDVLIGRRPAPACQIGMFAGDEPAEAAYPDDGEAGLQNAESVIQRKLACVKIYTELKNEFPFGWALRLHRYGTAESPTVPYIDIHPGDGDADEDPPLVDIVKGDFDSQIQKWAADIKAYGMPIWICFDGEMNGFWHSGSGASNGASATAGYGDTNVWDGPEVYVDAWRHIHNLFATAGVDNVAWVWSVNQSDWPDEEWNRFENYYPGDEYVDWLGVDGYNWDDPWSSFSTVFDAALHRLRTITGDKPLMLPEFACSHSNGAKSAWILDGYNRLKTEYPFVGLATWFHGDKEKPWTIDSDGAEAPRAALADPYFVSEGDPGTPSLAELELVNAAKGCPVTVSSVESGGLGGTNAVDGDYETRWSSAHSDPQWISVDLGRARQIRGLMLDWEGAYGETYAIQVSQNGTTWSNVFSQPLGNGGIDTILPGPFVGRHVRMYGTARATPWGYSLWEYEVYTPENDNALADWSFEGAGAGAWAVSSSSSRYKLNFDQTTVIHAGSQCLEVRWTQSIARWNACAVEQTVAVKGGNTWHAEAYARITTALDDSDAYIETIFYNGTTEVGKLQSSPLSGVCNWTRLTTTGIVPASATTARYRLVVLASRGTSSSGRLYWDSCFATQW